MTFETFSEGLLPPISSHLAMAEESTFPSLLPAIPSLCFGIYFQLPFLSAVRLPLLFEMIVVSSLPYCNQYKLSIYKLLITLLLKSKIIHFITWVYKILTGSSTLLRSFTSDPFSPLSLSIQAAVRKVP